MRADKLNKLKMPKKSAPENEAELDMGLEFGGDEEMEFGEDSLDEGVLEEGEAMDEEIDAEMFADIDDAMLIEEMKLRGLSLDEEEDEEMDDDEEEADMDMLDI